MDEIDWDISVHSTIVCATSTRPAPAPTRRRSPPVLAGDPVVEGRLASAFTELPCHLFDDQVSGFRRSRALDRHSPCTRELPWDRDQSCRGTEGMIALRLGRLADQ